MGIGSGQLITIFPLPRVHSVAPVDAAFDLLLFADIAASLPYIQFAYNLCYRIGERSFVS